MSVVFRIPLRHKRTGNELHFDDRQSLADFFVTHPRADYEGWENLGKLPAPTIEALREAAEAGDTILEGDEILEAWAGKPDYSDAEDRANRTDLGAVPEGAEAGVPVLEPVLDVLAQIDPGIAAVVAPGSAEPAAVDPDATLPGTPVQDPQP